MKSSKNIIFIGDVNHIQLYHITKTHTEPAKAFHTQHDYSWFTRENR